MKRLAALVAAVLMVVGALALRQARDDADETAVDPGEDPRGILCADDLADVCRAAGIELAPSRPAGETADALVGADGRDALGGSAWLVTSAWADLVQAERDRQGNEALVGVAGEPLASSAVVLAIWEDRSAQLVERCELPGGQLPGWRCLAEQAGEALDAGDRVRIAGPEVDSAVGLVVAAAQAASVVGRTDFASNDPDAGDLGRLAPALSGGPAGDPLRRMRVEGPGQVTATGTVRAHAGNLASSFGKIVAAKVAPAVRADVVLVVPAGSSVSGSDRQALIDALLAAGWDPPADGPTGLPSGGVLAAIRTLWAQSR